MRKIIDLYDAIAVINYRDPKDEDDETIETVQYIVCSRIDNKTYIPVNSVDIDLHNISKLHYEIIGLTSISPRDNNED